MYKTDMYEGMLAETVTLPGFGGDLTIRPWSFPRYGYRPPYARLG